MAEPAHIDWETLRKEAVHCYRGFVRFNRQKLRRILSRMNPQDRDTFLCIPQLLNVNIPGLPGHIHSPHAPEGIVGFERSQEADAAFDTVFPRVRRFIRPPLHRPSIEHLSVMGSLGSIAHTDKSDVDYWVCYDSEILNKTQAELLTRRLTAIEDWAYRERGLEVHFFLLDTQRVRNNDFGSVNSESSGTAQAKLLKEEFYRTCTVVMGRNPAWWMTPPGASEEEFRLLLERNKRDKLIDPDEILDLGHIANVPTAEFFGATLWQLSKALQSPFKSLLKMALLAWYLDGKHGSLPLLCDVLKERVARGADSEEETDPYLLMFDTISAYYRDRGDREAYELVNQSFYLKTGRADDPMNPTAQEAQRRDLVRQHLQEHYGIEVEWLNALDRLDGWHLEEIHELGLKVRSFMLETYRFLRGHAEALQSRDAIHPADLTVLGRKLEGALSEKEGKIPRLVNNFVGNNTRGVRLLMRRQLDTDGLWDLLLGGSGPQAEGGISILRGDDLCEMLLLLIFNRLVDRRTAIDVVDHRSSLRQEEVRTLAQRAAQFIGGVDPFKVSATELLQPPTRRGALAVLNLESWGGSRREADAMAPPGRTMTGSFPAFNQGGSKPVYSDIQRVAHRRDLLNDGPERRCIVDAIELATLNSWGELFIKHYEGPDAVVQMLCELLSGYAEEVRALLDGLDIWSPRHPLAGSMTARLTALIGEAIPFLHGNRLRPDTRRSFVVEVSGRYHVLTRRVTGVQYDVAQGLDRLRALLGSQDGSYAEVAIDSGNNDLVLERRVYAEQERDQIQLFLRRQRGLITVLVLDEMGRLRTNNVAPERYNGFLARRLTLLRALAARLKPETSAVTAPAAPTSGLLGRRTPRSSTGVPSLSLRVYRLDKWHDAGDGYSVHDVSASVLGTQSSAAPQGVPLRIGGVVALNDPTRAGLQVALDTEVYEVGDEDDMNVLARSLRSRYPRIQPGDIYITDSEVECELSARGAPAEVGAALHVELGELTERRLGEALMRLAADQEPVIRPLEPPAPREMDFPPPAEQAGYGGG